MRLLRDKEIHALLTGADPILTEVDTASYLDSDSQTRAAAINLRIGDIYLPGTKAGDKGSVDDPMTSHTLESGETAIVTTIESFNLRANIVGLVFPSSRVSIHALLMTNPGYIDPGYIGKLRFTLINMGERSYDLRQRDTIVTMVLFQMDQDSEASWCERNPKKRYLSPEQDDLYRLSKDFLNVQKRSEKVADDKVQQAALALKGVEKKWQVWAVVIAAGMTLVTVLLNFGVNWYTGTLNFDKRLAVLEKSLDVSSVKRDIEDHERRLKAVETEPRAGGRKQ